jgi:magnesium chelatase family protein
VGLGEIREFYPVDEAGHSLLRATTPARATAGVRVADLIGAERIETAHLAEAIQYRPRWQV